MSFMSRWTRTVIPLSNNGLPSGSDVFRIINNKFIRNGAVAYKKNSNVSVLEHSNYTARLLDQFSVPELTIAGLLHDYGQVALGNVTSDLSGLPHGAIGYYLLTELGLPLTVCSLVRYHDVIYGTNGSVKHRLNTSRTANTSMSFTYASYLLRFADNHAVGHIPNFNHYQGIEEFKYLFHHVLELKN